MRNFRLFLLLLLLSSCRILGWRDQSAIFPPTLVDNLFKESHLYWEIQYQNTDGDFIVETHPDEQTFPVFADFEKGAVVPVLLRACIPLEEGKEFRSKPAGFLYPFDLSGSGEGTFSWAGGPLCQFLYENRDFLNGEKLNINRLRALMEEEAEYGSQWSLDLQVMKEELLIGDFSTYDMRRRRDRSVSMNLAEGLWLNCDPQGEDLLSEGLTVPLETVLYTGIHSYLHSSGKVLEIHIFSDGSNEYIVY